MILGGVIGVEREVADKPAGFRTHMLIAGAAAAIVGLSMALIREFQGQSLSVRGDPVRVIEAIFTGLSFLGAGTIMRRDKGEHVEGLTTASSILIVAAIGVASALSLWILAVSLCVMTLLILRCLHWVQWWIDDRRKAGAKIVVENLPREL